MGRAYCADNLNASCSFPELEKIIGIRLLSISPPKKKEQGYSGSGFWHFMMPDQIAVIMMP
ncbi:hypothetical protein [Candidatus Sororendozoicomonas aggregata]|uniref:hypothetical protein n=1 Tax=Candidatus Sororendozoicomonas aggregata TaxID=3073239 RepID=UPI002ED40AD2